LREHFTVPLVERLSAQITDRPTLEQEQEWLSRHVISASVQSVSDERAPRSSARRPEAHTPGT